MSFENHNRGVRDVLYQKFLEGLPKSVVRVPAVLSETRTKRFLNVSLDCYVVYVEDWGSYFLWNIGNQLPVSAVSYPTKYHSWYPSLYDHYYRSFLFSQFFFPFSLSTYVLGWGSDSPLRCIIFLPLVLRHPPLSWSRSVSHGPHQSGHISPRLTPSLFRSGVAAETITSSRQGADKSTIIELSLWRLYAAYVYSVSP